MGIFKGVKKKPEYLYSTTFQSHSSPAKSPAPPPTTSTFPRFPDLSTEIRLKIWELALEPRIVPVHVHLYDHELIEPLATLFIESYAT
ncbi:hypothetical protein G7Y89_g14051 [Cudoniella acicularis]|uniref:2EXR domain-containing protein n=1 Tax=Cudoniella acicularis TaxID=354080 RepID=A0A8H4R6B8_9HELO|nr:hypothetical protein G7Y89_g14051 [Cudoniella acicularis]